MRSEKRVLYLDESGTAEFTDTRTPKSEYFVITAMVVDEDEGQKLSGYFEYLKRSHGLHVGIPFHSYDLFENKKFECYQTPTRMRALVHSLTEFFSLAPIRYRVYAVDKEKVQEHFRINRKLSGADYQRHNATSINSISYALCAANAFRWFTEILRYANAKGSIVAESRDRSDKSLIDTFLDCKDEGMYAQPLGGRQYRECDKGLKQSAVEMKKRVTGLKFETKIGESFGLELADLISYLAFLNLQRRLGEFERLYIPQLWQAVRNKLDTKTICLLQGNDLSNSLARSRVHKISKFARKTRNSGTL